MTITNYWNYSCHKCGAANTFTIYRLIDSSSDPFVKEKIMDGSIFNFTCFNCLLEFPRIYDLVYHNPQKKFVVAFFPQVLEDEIVDDDVLALLEEEAIDSGTYYLKFPYITSEWADFKLAIYKYSREMALEDFQKKQYEDIAIKDPATFFTLISREQKFRKHSSFIYFAQSMIAKYNIAEIVLKKKREDMLTSFNNLNNLNELGGLLQSLNSEASESSTGDAINQESTDKDFYRLSEKDNVWGGEVYYLGRNKYRKISPVPGNSKLDRFNMLRFLDEGNYSANLQPDYSTEGITLLKYPNVLMPEKKCLFRASVLEDKFDVFGNREGVSFYDCCTGAVICKVTLREDEDTLILYHFYYDHKYFRKCGNLLDWAIDFMFKTYVLNQDTPCPLSPNLRDDPDAMCDFAFSLFGRKGIYGKVYESAFKIEF